MIELKSISDADLIYLVVVSFPDGGPIIVQPNGVKCATGAQSFVEQIFWSKIAWHDGLSVPISREAAFKLVFGG